MNEAIITRGLVKRYGSVNALDGFSLSIPSGSITGLVGRNGAGKTTWMMTVAGFILPDSGEINLLKSGPFDASRHGDRFAMLPQDSELPHEAKVRALLTHYARLQGLTTKAAKKSVDSLIKTFNLNDKANTPIRALSHGMRKRAMVAQCFVGDPEVVLLDEPLNGLDPVEAARLRSFIGSQRGRRTIVVSSHNLEDVERLCTHVALVSKGRLVKMDAISSFTHGTERIVYGLSSEPKDLASLREALPEGSFEWREKERTLVCSFASNADGIAEVNRRLLPVLLAQTDVVSVEPGQSLEEAFLSRS